MSTTTISFRTDRETKEEAMRLFSELGLDMSTALNMFLRQALVDNGIPFTPRRENPASAHARYEAENGLGEKFSSVDELMADLTDAS
ncbi:type II toxin-antitoxin system RelB/DinJ family antitoxin [Rothia sp. CCM 9417]|uniref:type II toxin-antitoxin system RelB/DinJ family antitoxin n=1 Tax=Rothia sp. CCM 9417 TaxID=3402657 RepID=UPI003AE49AF2